MPDPSVVSFDMSVLLRFPGLDVVQGDALLLGPDYQRGADVFRTIIHSCRQRYAAPFDDLVQRPDHALSREREVDLNAQPLTVEVVQHAQKPEFAAIRQAVGHEIHRPDQVRGLRDAELFTLVTLDPPPRLDPQVQLKLAVGGDCLTARRRSYQKNRHCGRRP